MYATPKRGAKLYQLVCQSGVPCGASVHVLGSEETKLTVYGLSPCVTPGAGFTSQRSPKERLNRCDNFHSSWAKAEKFVYNGYAGAKACGFMRPLFPWTALLLK